MDKEKNTLIIIGNGFDLAHGLKTSYNDLMQYIKNNYFNYSIQSHNGRNYVADSNDRKYQHYFPLDKKIENIALCFDKKFVINPLNNKSIFFKKLFEHFDKYNNWIDLESLYFDLITPHNCDYQLINQEFESLKTALKSYLLNEVENNIILDGMREIKTTLNGSSSEDYIFRRRLNESDFKAIISFNYTSKLIKNHINGVHKDLENSSKRIKLIHIHGELKNRDSPIIFGYGDDNSDAYKGIQDRNNNELLKNFKTFQYLRNENYREVLNILETYDNIDVEIIGHSCGISDKTLLKTIFEHPNVKNIEYLYHSDEDKYFNNIYSLARIFSENSLMREKVLPLSQTRKIVTPSF